MEADLIVFNADIHTMDPKNPYATALAVKSYKILAIGDEEEIAGLVSSAKRVIDAGGKLILPGFIDAHTHLTADGLKAQGVQLHGARSLSEMKGLLREGLAKHQTGQWLRAYGWDESTWDDRRFPTASDLDEVSRETPIMATRVDGHMVVVNTAGLEALALPPDTPGIERDSAGRPTGVLKDIEGLNERFRPSDQEVVEGAVTGCKILNRCGVTAAVDNAPAGYLRHIRTAERHDRLTVRVTVNPPVEHIEHMVELGITSGMGSPMVKVGGVKVFTDGSIGARTAALSQDYTDDPGNRGRSLMSRREYERIVRMAVENDIQTVTHAIGDAAIEMVISTFEDIGDRARIREQRHRIEHAEMMSVEQIRRAVGLGLILSMQPNFVGRWQQEGGLYETRLGPERTAEMNMFRVALDNGARVCFGSDGMPYGPLYGIWSATTHPNPKVRITVEEAIRCYTMESAYAGFVERTLGSLTVGKRADFVILSKNILRVPAEEIRQTTVEATFVGGRPEYSASWEQATAGRG